MTAEIWQPIRLSLQVATVATVLVAVTGTLLGWYLSERRGALSDTIASLVALPLVLPPTVIGFALLWLLGRDAPLGRLLGGALGEPILFHWIAAVFASAVVAFPLMVESARAGWSRCLCDTETRRDCSAPRSGTCFEPSRCRLPDAAFWRASY